MYGHCGSPLPSLCVVRLRVLLQVGATDDTDTHTEGQRCQKESEDPSDVCTSQISQEGSGTNAVETAGERELSCFEYFAGFIDSFYCGCFEEINYFVDY